MPRQAECVFAGVVRDRSALAELQLLEREPKESILGRFDVSVIGRYFPDFESAIRDER